MFYHCRDFSASDCGFPPNRSVIFGPRDILKLNTATSHMRGQKPPNDESLPIGPHQKPKPKRPPLHCVLKKTDTQTQAQVDCLSPVPSAPPIAPATGPSLCRPPPCAREAGERRNPSGARAGLVVALLVVVVYNYSTPLHSAPRPSISSPPAPPPPALSCPLPSSPHDPLPRPLPRPVPHRRARTRGVIVVD
jgi:hypothetical protein